MRTDEHQLQKERHEGDGVPTAPQEEREAQAHTLAEVEAREARRRSVKVDDAPLQSETNSTTRAAK